MEKEIKATEHKKILLDFDGTVLTNENFPSIGKDIGAVPVLQELVKNGHKLILWTRRFGYSLDSATKWFKDNNIELSDINPKPTSENIKPDFDLIIDDKALNTPLKYPKDGGKPYVNWVMVKMYLKKLRIL